jgi:hypothetical protein
MEIECSNCEFWYGSKAGPGHCRRYAPSPSLEGSSHLMGWPLTNGKDWCGEYQPRQTKRIMDESELG